jgi:hypothetical protein
MAAQSPGLFAPLLRYGLNFGEVLTLQPPSRFRVDHLPRHHQVQLADAIRRLAFPPQLYALPVDLKASSELSQKANSRRSGLLTRIAATESISLGEPMKS